MDNSRVFMLKRKMNTWCTLLIPSQQSPRSSRYSSAYPWKPWRFCPSDDGEYETKSSIMNRILCLYPLAKHPIPLGRESLFGRSLPRVYALTTYALNIMKDRGIRAAIPRYSNISSDPWQLVVLGQAKGFAIEGWGLMVEGWWVIDIVGVEYLFYLWIMCNLWFLAVF